MESLSQHSVIVVESPTGSGKTTGLPVILHEAEYDKRGIIGVTQPRRIAAVSVSSYIQFQLEKTDPGIVAYKMRFDDKTTPSTRIKIMTDGILLQELKLDPLLSAYSVIMVDEAHERSLNIDFVLGLLKRVIEERPEFRVIVSSATLNTQVFSEYFNVCPVVRIETDTYPVSTVYKALKDDNDDELVAAVIGVVGHVIEEKRDGDILIFLPGEKTIKGAITGLSGSSFRRKLHIVPLYGRLSKEEQDQVFVSAPWGKIKVVIATNIAETSITIDGITSVIDSGQAKLNYYNPKTFTSSLIQRPISRASANQRKGRAGRTRPGTCYRLYGKEDFEARPLFTQEEIYRTDLSEVVLRMAELGIRDFESFNFISSPGRQGILGAVDTLLLLEALNEDNSLSKIGTMMALFPLIPRHSRILVEAILNYPDVIDEALTGTSFLSCDNPFLLPQGQEIESRRAHHHFRDESGDFVSYLKIFKAYSEAENKTKFCEKFFFDESAMAEIANVKEQLGQIISGLGVPLSSGGSLADYICAVAKGLIQFICIKQGRSSYRSLTAEKVEIHPGSVMFRQTPRFIVAGEIVKTSRMFARSVGELRKEWLSRISPDLSRNLQRMDDEEAKGRHISGENMSANDYYERVRRETKQSRAQRPEQRASQASQANSSPSEAQKNTSPAVVRASDTSMQVSIAGRIFAMEPYKGKKKNLVLNWDDVTWLMHSASARELPGQHSNLRCTVKLDGNYTGTWLPHELVQQAFAPLDGKLSRGTGPHGLLMLGERLSRVLSISRWLDPFRILPTRILGKERLNIWENLPVLCNQLPYVLSPVLTKKNRELGFLTLYTNQDGLFWFKPTLAFSTALSETISSLEYLADNVDPAVHDKAASLIGRLYRALSTILEQV